MTLRTPDCLKHQLARDAARAWLPDLACFLPPATAFSTGARKKASEKKSMDPEKTTLALFLAWRPAISSVFLPVACGYWVMGSSGLCEYADDEAVKISRTNGLEWSAIRPVPCEKIIHRSECSKYYCVDTKIHSCVLTK